MPCAGSNPRTRDSTGSFFQASASHSIRVAPSRRGSSSSLSTTYTLLVLKKIRGQRLTRAYSSTRTTPTELFVMSKTGLLYPETTDGCALVSQTNSIPLGRFSKSSGFLTSPCTNVTPCCASRSRFDSLPRRTRLSITTTRWLFSLSRTANSDPTNPAPPVIKMCTLLHSRREPLAHGTKRERRNANWQTRIAELPKAHG